MRCRSFLLGTIISLVYTYAAAAAERIHIDFNGYRPATNDYCIGARSVQGDPMFGFLWRFSAGGGPSTVTGLPAAVNLLNTSSTQVFPTSISDREKFRVYGNPLGPLLGAKSISNELNARRDQTCQSGGGGGGGIVIPLLPVFPPAPGGGGGIVIPLLPVFPPAPGGGGGIIIPVGPVFPQVPGGGPTPELPPDGGVGGGGFGGNNIVVNDPEIHRQLARVLGTDFSSRGDVISDAVSCGLGMQQALGSGVNAAAIAPRWCVWATPRQLNYTNDRSGLTFTGTLRDITFGLDYRVLPNLVVGLAFTPEDTKVDVRGVDASFRQTGFGGGPYLGWQIRPTTVFDIWAGYSRLDRSFDIIGLTASAPVDRTFVSMNLTETINTPWMRILPRLTYFQAQDRVGALTIDSFGFTLVGTNYDYRFSEASVEFNRDVWFSNGLLLQPWLRATARYDMQRVVDTITNINGDDVELERWHGQLRAGLRAQFGPAVQLSLSGGYLSFFTPGVSAWEARARLTSRF